MKTLRLLTLAVTTTLSTLPALAHDFYLPNADGKIIYYNITDRTNKTVEVTRYNSLGLIDPIFLYTGDIVIPSSVKYNDVTYTVTAIGYEAFNRSHENVISVIIPNSVKSIGEGAFSFCSNLTSVTIPNSVRLIGDKAFWFCTSLKTVTIPNSVTSIGDGTFDNCTSLTSVAIPNSVASIGKWAFSGCTGLSSVTIPNSVTSIGDEPFAFCPNLSAFYGKFASDDNRCLIVDGRLIAFAPNGVTSYSIPNFVTTIAPYTFATIGLDGLTAVTIPAAVTEISYGAFAYCPLKSIYAKPITPPVCTYDVSDYDGSIYGVFDGVDKAAATLYVPQASLEAYKAADTWSEFLNIVPDTSSITEVTEDEDPDTPAVYYDLNGVRVESPESGNLYIRHDGKSTQKIVY